MALLSLSITAAAAPGSPLSPAVGPAAVWHPDPGFFARFHKRCAGRRGADFDACFAAAMAASNASPAALDFTRRLDNRGYLQALAMSGGPIAVAHVFFPFRANENDAWLLVNGAPPSIDVDDRRWLPLERLRADPAFRAIRRRYPNVALWPGERGPVGPGIAVGGREIIVDYVLRDLCHACAIVGRVECAFDFTTDGSFVAVRLLRVTPGDT